MKPARAFPAAALAASLVLCAAHAAAQEVELKMLRVETPTTVAVESAESVLMNVAGPLPTSAGPGETFRQIIERSCPRVTSAYLAAAGASLVALNPGLQGPIDLDAPAPQDQNLLIPFCVTSEFDTHVFKQGEHVWTLYEVQQHDPDGFAHWPDFLTHYERLNGSIDAAVGEQALVPKAAVRVPLWSDTIDDVGRALVEKPGIDSYMDAGPRNWGEIQTDPVDPCEEFDAAESHARSEQSFRQVAEALAINKMIDTEHSWERDPQQRIIGILDSGVADFGSALGSQNRWTMRGVDDRDIKIDSRDNRSFHGSGVRSVALGGHLFAQINPLMGSPGEAPYRIVEYYCPPARNGVRAPCAAEATDDRLRDGLAAVARNGDISVVNLSTVFRAKIDDLDRYTATDARFLLVVAAGNEGLDLDDASSPYPAKSGGVDNRNLIAVAGLDFEGDLMKTSNRSSDYIDIGAWGCAVPVLEYHADTGGYQIKYRSGTSYATPRVSFIAAMVAAEARARSGGFTPVDIKKRILFSADIDGSQWDAIRHGRRLNARKALLVHSDVVELADGTLLLGRVKATADQSDLILCPNHKVARSELRKIARLETIPGEPGAKRYLVYTEDKAADGRVETLWCDQLFAAFELEDMRTGQSTPLDLATVKDIVFAAQPYWR